MFINMLHKIKKINLPPCYSLPMCPSKLRIGFHEHQGSREFRIGLKDFINSYLKCLDNLEVHLYICM